MNPGHKRYSEVRCQTTQSPLKRLGSAQLMGVPEEPWQRSNRDEQTAARMPTQLNKNDHIDEQAAAGMSTQLKLIILRLVKEVRSASPCTGAGIGTDTFICNYHRVSNTVLLKDSSNSHRSNNSDRKNLRHIFKHSTLMSHSCIAAIVLMEISELCC